MEDRFNHYYAIEKMDKKDGCKKCNRVYTDLADIKANLEGVYQNTAYSTDCLLNKLHNNKYTLKRECNDAICKDQVDNKCERDQEDMFRYEMFITR